MITSRRVLNVGSPPCGAPHRFPFATLKMKFEGRQFFDINSLKGQLVINENGAEFFIKDVLVDVADHRILIGLSDGNAVDWESIQNWSIQFQGGQNEQA